MSNTGLPLSIWYWTITTIASKAYLNFYWDWQNVSERALKFLILPLKVSKRKRARCWNLLDSLLYSVEGKLRTPIVPGNPLTEIPLFHGFIFFLACGWKWKYYSSPLGMDHSTRQFWLYARQWLFHISMLRVLFCLNTAFYPDYNGDAFFRKPCYQCHQ